MIPLLAMCVTLIVLIIPSMVLYKLWWIPHRIQALMESQGIRGPSYKFLHGNTKEIIKMKQHTSDAAMEVSDHDIFPRIQPHLYSWINLYGKNYLQWIGTTPELVVTELELIKEILSNKEGTFPKTIVEGYMKKMFGDGLVVVADGEKWFRQRKLANHAFHGDSLKGTVPGMIACVETMLDTWRSHHGQEMDVCNELRVLTSQVISKTAFGSSYLEGKKIFDMLAKLIILNSRNLHKIKLFGFKKFMRTEDEIEAERTEQLLHESIMEIVRKREDEVRRGESDDFGADFLGSLMKSHHDLDPKNQISSDDIIDECKTVYLSGQETTYSLLSWATLLLSIYTDWQQKAREEVFTLFGNRNPNADGLSKLNTVNMILYETMRLYAPATLLTRRIGKKLKLGNYEFPTGLTLAIPTLAVHRNVEIWGEDAHMFKPERFEKGVAKATNGNSVAFLGFGFGPRTCVGLNFTINEAKIALAMILQRYEFTLSKGYVHSPFIPFTNQPQHGVQILLHPLNVGIV